MGTLAHHIFKGNGIQQEKTLHRDQSQFLRVMDEIGSGGDDPIRFCSLRQKIHGDLPPVAQSLDQIRMDKGQLACCPDPLYDLPDVQDRPIQNKHGSTFRSQGMGKSHVVFYSRNHRSLLNRFFKRRLSAFHKLPSHSASVSHTY